MQLTYDYLIENFKLLEVLKSNQEYSVELVLGSDRNAYIRRKINNNFAPYLQLRDVVSPYVARIYYVASDGEKTVVIEEYVNGLTLNELLEQEKVFSEKQVMQIALDLSYGLEAMHNKGIIHRDIKPGNIMLQEDGHIKIIDFNASRMLTKDKCHDTRILGTEGYAPPEQYGFMTTDQRSDWYAVGKTLESILEHSNDGKLKALINKCVRFDPQDRVKSAQEFRKLLTEDNNKKTCYLLAFLAVFVLGLSTLWHTKSTMEGVKPSQPAPSSKVEQKAEVTVKPEEKPTLKVESQAEPFPKENSKKTASVPSNNEEKNIANKKQTVISATDSWEKRKKIMDETMPLRYFDTKTIVLKAVSPEGSYPRELSCGNIEMLQPFVLFQREKNISQAVIRLVFQNFTIIPPKEGTVPYLGNYREHITFWPKGDINAGLTIDVSHYWKSSGFWKPYNYYYPLLGGRTFKYYQLGPNPGIIATLDFQDGQKISKIIPIKIL